MRFIMQNVFQVGLLALVVVFQPELRSALEKVGSEQLQWPEKHRRDTRRL